MASVSPPEDLQPGESWECSTDTKITTKVPSFQLPLMSHNDLITIFSGERFFTNKVDPDDVHVHHHRQKQGDKPNIRKDAINHGDGGHRRGWCRESFHGCK